MMYIAGDINSGLVGNTFVHQCQSSYLSSLGWMEVDVCAHASAANTCAEKMSALETTIQTGMNFVLPLRSKTI